MDERIEGLVHEGRGMDARPNGGGGGEMGASYT